MLLYTHFVASLNLFPLNYYLTHYIQIKIAKLLIIKVQSSSLYIQCHPKVGSRNTDLAAAVAAALLLRPARDMMG